MICATRVVTLTPYLILLSTVFVVNRDLVYGMISGKYFWFYLSMGVLAVWSILAVAKHTKEIRFNWNDGLIMLFGLIVLPVSYWGNCSDATTRHILLILIIILYFYFKIVF